MQTQGLNQGFLNRHHMYVKNKINFCQQIWILKQRSNKVAHSHLYNTIHQ